jgi:hypothetical protein
MGFDYLFHKKWSDISRDERRFCADLIFQLKINGTEKEFINWIILHNNLSITSFKEYEIDFEVCFYRDLIFDYELEKNVTLAGKKEIKGFLKRTFDICIFLPNDIIIIEAKAAKGMTSEQMMEFKYDKLAIKSCLKYLKLPTKNVHVIGLVSQEYDTTSVIALNKKHNYFNGIISWADIENNNTLKYVQPDKLKKVYKETSKKRKSGELELINHLNDLTSRMHKHIQSEKK